MPVLITVNGSRIPLCLGHTYLVGRGSECDIVVRDHGCSRRHARIVVSDASPAAFVEDLGSRNGTYLDGKQVGGRANIPEKGRLQLGSSVFLVELAGELAEQDLEETRALWPEGAAADGDAEGGELAALGLSALIELLIIGKRSVAAEFALSGAMARIDVRHGEVLAATHGDLVGFNALVRIAREKNGIFWITECTDPVETNIQEPSSHLLVELSRCLS